MVLVKARVLDSTHLELAEPIATGQCQTVVVSVAEMAEEDAEHQIWLGASVEGLRFAYGQSEPDYEPTMLKEDVPDKRA